MDTRYDVIIVGGWPGRIGGRAVRGAVALTDLDSGTRNAGR